MTYRDISILVVEDNPGDARLLRELLSETEYTTAQCHVVGTLKAAREVPVSSAPVAIVLLDLSLPDSDGIDSLLAIREKFPDSAIVIVTGLDDEEMAIQALREGAQNYMIKGEITANRLSRTLRYSIERYSFIKRLREEEHRSADLQASERAMRTALEKERQLNELKSHFVSMVSHEFRSPLAVIQGSVDLIDRYAGGPDMCKVQTHTARIQMKVHELTVMLGDVLDVERLEQQVVRCEPTEFDLVPLCNQVLTDMRSLTRAGQRLVHKPVGGDHFVLLDHHLLSKVLTNLISNAIKYSPENGCITVHSSVERGLIRLSVEDEGAGIPAEEQGLLFERFFRGSNAHGYQGTGLGLSIVKQYLDLMGGHIDFSSVPGRTEFVVELPSRMTR
jgi:signal transduction histidine kinase